MKKDIITQQQKKFLKEYSDSLNPQKAALNGGYSAKSAQIQARELLNREKYISELNKLIELNADHLEISKAFLVKKYLQLIDWASGITYKNRLDGDLRDFREPKDPTLLLRALDGLAKQLEKSKDEEQSQDMSGFGKINGLDKERI